MAETTEKPPKDIESDDEEEQMFESLGLDAKFMGLAGCVAWVPKGGWVLDVEGQRLGGGVRVGWAKRLRSLGREEKMADMGLQIFPSNSSSSSKLALDFLGGGWVGGFWEMAGWFFGQRRESGG
ncbi:unnamed protein product [Prunus brigantina]